MNILRLIFFLLVASFAGTVLATPAQIQELKQIEEIQEKLDLQKQWAKYRLDKSNVDCYKKFFTSACLKDNRAVYNQELRVIREQELPMHDRQRELKEALKTERDKEREAERNDPSKAKERDDNRRAFEEKQEKRVQRARDLEERRKDADKRSKENRNSSPF